jgi:predicted DNA-binding protein (MmcQ/YjbR family)
MNLEKIRDFALAFPGVEETFPFDNQTLVFKVAGKMFLALDVENTLSINVKCDPEMAVELRERYDTILPGYHMSKKHWNTIMLHGRYGEKEILGWIRDSYELVFNSLPQKVKAELSL